jgi:hypothetical protein
MGNRAIMMEGSRGNCMRAPWTSVCMLGAWGATFSLKSKEDHNQKVVVDILSSLPNLPLESRTLSSPRRKLISQSK